MKLWLVLLGGFAENYLATQESHKISRASYRTLVYNVLRAVCFLLWFKPIVESPSVSLLVALRAADFLGTWLAVWRMRREARGTDLKFI